MDFRSINRDLNNSEHENEKCGKLIAEPKELIIIVKTVKR